MIEILDLQNGTLTYSDISASYGRDTEELFEQHQKEIELAKQYEIELANQDLFVLLLSFLQLA